MASAPLGARVLEPSHDLVQQVHDLLERDRRWAAVEQVRDRTQEVAEQVPGPLLSGDREVNLVQVDYQPEQVEVERT